MLLSLNNYNGSLFREANLEKRVSCVKEGVCFPDTLCL